MKKILFFGLLIIAISACNSENKTETSENAATSSPTGGVSFVEPIDGALVNSPLKIVMAVEGMEVEPAGMVNAGKGHHHLIIDGNFVEKGTVVPADSTHIHFGKGQTEFEVALTPGTHTLTLQFADGIHNSYGKAWSKTIEITVEAPM